MCKRVLYLGAIMAALLSGCGAESSAPVESAAVVTTAESEKESSFKEIVEAESSKEDLQDEMMAEYAKEKYMQECQPFDYKEYFRYEDKYKGTKVYLEAEIQQVMDNNTFRCYSDMGDEYLVQDKREADTTRLLADDFVVIWGEYAGTSKVERAISDVEEDIMVIDAKYIDIYEEESDFADYQTELSSAKADGYEENFSEPAYKTMYVVNCRESITLRTNPSTSASEICQIPLGAVVSYISSAENGFYKVTYLGNTGYALASYLGEEADSSSEIYYSTMYVVNCNESITLRTSPSTSASEICQIPLGASVSFIEGAANGFYKISYLGQTGYALASYLEF